MQHLYTATVAEFAFSSPEYFISENQVSPVIAIELTRSDLAIPVNITVQTVPGGDAEGTDSIYMH